MRIAIIQRIVPHYRIQFFRKLQAVLAEQYCSLDIFYGRERQGTVPKTASLHEPWAHEIKNTYFSVGGREFVWQDLPSLHGYDLVIVEHAARLLNNYALLFKRKVGAVKKLAYWGHGGNFQAGYERPKTEWLKRLMARQVDHWFAYTELSAERVTSMGVNAKNVTTVNNSIDTTVLRAAQKSLTPEELVQLRQEVGIEGKRIGLYCGGLYAEKRIPFVIDAAVELRKKLPDFELVVIGDGPDAKLIEAASEKYQWIKYVGVKEGGEVVPYFELARCVLMPGPVGLVIVDAISLGVPLMTTENRLHGPEIAYLKPGVNGMMVGDSLGEYVDAVYRCMTDDEHYGNMVAGCRADADRLNLDSMVARFKQGIMRAAERSNLNL